jgi:hypothetical protein
MRGACNGPPTRRQRHASVITPPPAEITGSMPWPLGQLHHDLRETLRAQLSAEVSISFGLPLRCLQRLERLAEYEGVLTGFILSPGLHLAMPSIEPGFAFHARRPDPPEGRPALRKTQWQLPLPASQYSLFRTRKRKPSQSYRRAIGPRRSLFTLPPNRRPAGGAPHLPSSSAACLRNFSNLWVQVSPFAAAFRRRGTRRIGSRGGTTPCARLSWWAIFKNSRGTRRKTGGQPVDDLASKRKATRNR